MSEFKNTAPENLHVEYPPGDNYDDVKLSNVTIIFRSQLLSDLLDALNKIGVMGVTITQVTGYGTQKGFYEYYSKVNSEIPKPLWKTKIEIIVPTSQAKKVIDTSCKVLYTGKVGDGKIFVYNVESILKIRTGEIGYDAIEHSETNE
ncbi:MAG: P-II family nitrogen regulator [Clostridiales bacterium]|jgi:Amt family ammonium transporter|nr:P-II family nitrogen regulator [Clostridiales bacterium]